MGTVVGEDGRFGDGVRDRLHGARFLHRSAGHPDRQPESRLRGCCGLGGDERGVEPVGNSNREVDLGDWALRHVEGIENDEVRTIRRRVVDKRKDPSFAFSGAFGNEERLAGPSTTTWAPSIERSRGGVKVLDAAERDLPRSGIELRQPRVSPTRATVPGVDRGKVSGRDVEALVSNAEMGSRCVDGPSVPSRRTGNGLGGKG